jgi:sortase A
MKRRTLLAEGTLWLIGIAGTAVVAVAVASAVRAQSLASQVASAEGRHEQVVPAGTPVEGDSGLRLRSGQVLGRVEIGGMLSVPLLEDDDTSTLLRGVGHIPGTALPGGLGNVVIAGHRDTFFRPLRRVTPGMHIDVTTRSGRFRYTVDRTEVVTPDTVQVTAMGERPEMTLITCFPFDYVGPAPRRFIVHAHLLSLDPM